MFPYHRLTLIKQRKRQSQLLKAGFENYTIIEAEPNYIGGFVLENERQTIRLNKTFAEALYLKRGRPRADASRCYKKR